MTELEIADILGITESRVSQIMRGVERAVGAAAVLSEVASHYNDDPEYSKLEIRWITL